MDNISIKVLEPDRPVSLLVKFNMCVSGKASFSGLLFLHLVDNFIVII